MIFFFFLAVSNATCNVGTNPGTWVPYVSPKLRIEKTWQLISSTSKNNTTNLDICLLADNIPWLAGIALPSHSTTVEIIFIGDSTDLKMIELCSINSGNATRGSILGTEVTYCFIPGLRIFHIRFYGVHLNGPYFRDASSTDVLSWLYTSISKLKDHIKHTPDIVIISSNYWDTAGLYWREGLPNRTRRDAHIWPPAPWYQRPSLLPLQFLLDWKSNFSCIVRHIMRHYRDVCIKYAL